MMMPSIFGENLIDDFFGFDYPFRGYQRENTTTMMKTDVKEHENEYELEVSLPGYKKEDIQAELKDGYLTIKASTSQNNDEKDEKTGKYIRRERYSGSCSRSFYVGENVKQEEIKAKYENGVLDLMIPKKDPKKPAAEEKKYIAIEG
ncbi:MAG: Hsp20/alpha crystallin family protein [Eubacteriales bacterium]|nr:Hsp20/alpha crystallin family protein [Eubacteriales bacterium]